MENNVLKLIKYLYYFSLITLIVLYLFPGSLLAYLIYGDFGKQPDFISNPIGTSINHTLAFFYLSIIGLITYLRDKNFNQIIIFLIFLSIILELSHYLVPNRSFQFLDLFANLFGVVIALFIIVIFKKFKKIL